MTTTLDLGFLATGAILAWWGSTGLLLLLMGRPERTYSVSMTATTTVAIMAVWIVVATRDTETTFSAVLAFLSAISIWGAVELAFLMGYVVGPRKVACPSGVSVWPRFCASFSAIAYHEFALLAAMLGLLWIVHSAANQLAFQIFALMWAMRLSTKLNIFLGVANVSSELLPHRVAYLATYFRHAPINPLFPFSVTAATILVWHLATGSVAPGASDFDAASATLLATFAALALLEHWMLVLPITSKTFWPWCPSAADTKSPSTHSKEWEPRSSRKRPASLLISTSSEG